MKLIPALATTTIGGGVFAGVVPSSSNDSSSTVETSLTTQLKVETLQQVPQAPQQLPEQIITNSQDPQPQESSSAVSAIKETQVNSIISQEVQTGNCIVISTPEEVKKQLPKNIVYVAFSCKNNNRDKSSLEDWKGYFPSDLLVKKSDSFKDGDRVNIDVTDKEDYVEQQQLQEFESDTEEEPIWTLFESDQFTTRTITGNYGSSTAKDGVEEEEVDEDSQDDEKTVYKVRMLESAGPKEFYLQWL